MYNILRYERISSRSEYEPVGILHQEDVGRADGKKILGQATQGIVDGRKSGTIRPVLCPYQEESGPGFVFPAQHHIRPELEEIEVGIINLVIGHTILVFIHAVKKIILIVTDLIAGKSVKSISVAFSFGGRYSLESGVFALSYKRLSPKLNGQVGVDIIVYPNFYSVGRLIQGARNVSIISIVQFS